MLGASTAAHKTTPNQTVYSATKAAVLAISDGLRQELAGRMRVTVISPGLHRHALRRSREGRDRQADQQQATKKFAMPPVAVARAIGYAIDQPDDVNVGEVVVRSTAQP